MSVDPVKATDREFLEDELSRAYESREAAKAGSQAEAAFGRQIRDLRKEIEALNDESSPTRGLSPTEILAETQKRANGLPEIVLAVFADTWARRHKVKWVPMELDSE